MYLLERSRSICHSVDRGLEHDRLSASTFLWGGMCQTSRLVSQTWQNQSISTRDGRGPRNKSLLPLVGRIVWWRCHRGEVQYGTVSPCSRIKGLISQPTAPRGWCGEISKILPKCLRRLFHWESPPSLAPTNCPWTGNNLETDLIEVPLGVTRLYPSRLQVCLLALNLRVLENW